MNCTCARHYALCEEYPTALKLYLKAPTSPSLTFKLFVSHPLLGGLVVWCFFLDVRGHLLQSRAPIRVRLMLGKILPGV